jgi:hypothetical protein
LKAYTEGDSEVALAALEALRKMGLTLEDAELARDLADAARKLAERAVEDSAAAGAEAGAVSGASAGAANAAATALGAVAGHVDEAKDAAQAAQLALAIIDNAVAETNTDRAAAEYAAGLAAASAASAASGSNFTQPQAGAVVRTLQSKLRESLSFYDFGAVGNGIVDDTPAVKAAIAAHLATGIPLHTGAGTFLVSSQIVVDAAQMAGAGQGVAIHGAGQALTVLRSTWTAGVPFIITATSGTATTSNFNHVSGIFFDGLNDSGPVLQVAPDDFSRTFWLSSFTRLRVRNTSVNDAAEGLRLNALTACDVNVWTTCAGSGAPGAALEPGHGTALVVRRVQLSRITGRASEANTAIYVGAGVSVRNVFEVDAQLVTTGLKIDYFSVSGNEFRGSLAALYCVNATAGTGNIVRSVLSTYVGGAFINGTNNVGITFYLPGQALAVNQPLLVDALPGGKARIEAKGPDTSVSMEIAGKGTAGWLYMLVNNVARLTVQPTLIDMALPVRMPIYTYATLPMPTAAKWCRALISDGNVVAAGNFGASVISGGGSVMLPLYSDGTIWRIG